MRSAIASSAIPIATSSRSARLRCSRISPSSRTGVFSGAGLLQTKWSAGPLRLHAAVTSERRLKPEIGMWLYNHDRQAHMFKRDVPFPVLVARRSYLFGGITCAVIRPPVFLREAPAFQVKRDSPQHFLDNEARFDPRLGAIDQRIDQDAGFLRRKRLIVNRVPHFA